MPACSHRRLVTADCQVVTQGKRPGHMRGSGGTIRWDLMNERAFRPLRPVFSGYNQTCQLWQIGTDGNKAASGRAPLSQGDTLAWLSRGVRVSERAPESWAWVRNAATRASVFTRYGNSNGGVLCLLNWATLGGMKRNQSCCQDERKSSIRTW